MNIISFVYPFLVQVDVNFNVLKLKGIVKIKLFGKFKFEIKIRIKNGYVYINIFNKERREKITEKNLNIMFILNLIKQFYFRQQLIKLGIRSKFGYKLDSCVTAVGSGYIDVLSKCVFAKIKNNKKKSHIFTEVEPNYNDDIFNFKLEYAFRISMFDIIYSLICSLFYLWRSYERNRKYKIKQG